MGLFHKKPKPKNPQLLKFINHRPIKYVASRDENGVEVVLGKNGRINVYEDSIVISCEGKEVFRCNLLECEAGELMSRDGVRIDAVGEDGVKRAVTAYYVYRR